MEHPSGQLRRSLLSLLLLEQGQLAELELGEDGVHLDLDDHHLHLTWDECALAADLQADAEPTPATRRRLARWIRMRVRLATWRTERGDDYVRFVISLIRPRALPIDHDLHPGHGWIVRPVLGGSTHSGLALRGFTDDAQPDSDFAGLLPVALLDFADIPRQAAIEQADRYVHDMAQLAVDRHRKDPIASLRSLGDADVPTLLSNSLYRSTILDGQGMRSAAVPTRHRGWLDLGRLDPAFAISAADLTDPDDRGYSRPILITADEITMVKPGGNIIGQALDDPVRG